MYTLLVDLPLWLGFVVTLIVCWGLTIIGLPGNWLIVAVSAAAVWLAPADSRLAIAPAVWIILVLLAAAGEALEVIAGSTAANRAGGTRRGAVGAIVGAFLGAIVGAALGLPIPIVGSAVAAVLGGAVGALVGALAAELQGGRDMASSMRVGHAAFWGRLVGTLSKAALGGVMVVVASIAAGV